MYFRTSIKGLFIFLFHIVMVTDKQVLVVNHSSYRGKKKKEGRGKRKLIVYDYKPKLTALFWTSVFLDLAPDADPFLLHHSHLAICILSVAPLCCVIQDTQMPADKIVLGDQI